MKQCEEFIGACLTNSEGVSDKIGVYRIIVTQRGWCNDIFYNGIREFGNIHNGHVKMNTPGLHYKISVFSDPDSGKS